MRRATLFLFAALCVACALPAAGADAGEGVAPGAMRVATLVVDTRSGRQIEYTVELALSEAERRQGLMGRHRLAPDAGMLFDFGAAQPIAMWMRNTYLALDMVFADEAGVIVDIIAHTTPLSEALLMPRAAARYVLELGAGQTAARGIAAGDRLRLRTSP